MTLTREAILALPAGPELDALVAEQVMGQKPRPVRVRDSTETVTVYSDTLILSDGAWTADKLHCHGDPLCYSTNWCVLLPVVEKLRAALWLVTLKWMPPGAPFRFQGSWSEYDAPCPDTEVGHSKALCELHCMDRKRVPWRPDMCAFAETMPLALCRAALLAVEREGR